MEGGLVATDAKSKFEQCCKFVERLLRDVRPPPDLEDEKVSELSGDKLAEAYDEIKDDLG